MKNVKTREELMTFDEFGKSKDALNGSKMSFGNLPIHYHSWFITGYEGENIIFLTEDVQDLSDEKIISMIEEAELLKPNPDIDTSITRYDDYTRVTFNVFDNE